MAIPLIATVLLMSIYNMNAETLAQGQNMKFDRNTLTKDQLLLYAVTDRHWLNGRTLHSVVKESLDGGVTFVQLREKQLDEAHFMEEAKDLQALCREYNVPLSLMTMWISHWRWMQTACMWDRATWKPEMSVQN